VARLYDRGNIVWCKIFGGVGFCGIKYYAAVETRRGTSLVLLYLWLWRLWRRAVARLLWCVCTIGGILFGVKYSGVLVFGGIILCNRRDVPWHVSLVLLYLVIYKSNL